MPDSHLNVFIGNTLLYTTGATPFVFSSPSSCACSSLMLAAGESEEPECGRVEVLASDYASMNSRSCTWSCWWIRQIW